MLSNTKLNSGTVTTVDGVSLPSRINVVEAEANHGFKNFDDGRKWAKENIARTYDNEETNGKGNIRISNTAIDKFMSEKAVAKSESKDVHMAVLKVLPDIIRESVDAEQHEDRIKDENGIRKAGNTVNPDVMIHRLYGAVDIAGKIYRVKVTLKENVRTKETSKAYSYEATKIELLSGQSGDVTMTSPRNDNNSILTAKLLKDIEKSYGKGVKLLKDDKSSDPRFQIVGNSLSDEEKKIVETAKANDTYMKAPNGKPTNLSEKQWTQVRTKAFKKWFGDWEKAARIEKLRRSKAVKITEADYEDKYDLTRNSAKQWAKDNIRGEYMIADTGEKVNVSKVSINEVLSHGERDAAHLKSISSIGKLLHNAIFITETPNAKDNDKYESYRYYIEGVKIDGEDYTAKIVVGVKNGKTYYDHRLTKIEKGSLLDSLNGLSNSVAEKQQTSFTGKDSKLLSILQTNSSKVVDENGEPMVVYHGTLADGLRQFSTDFIGSRYSYDEKGFFFISNRKIADDYAVSEFDASRRGEVIDAYVSLGNPLVVNSEWCRKNGLGSNVFKDNDVIEFWDNYQSLIVEESEQNDGVIVTDGETSMAVAFSPNQIKSATSNNGNFSTTEDDILYRTVFGGNSGYVGYSMSKRAAEAKEEGRYPKTEFRREYHITAKSLDMLTSLGFINNSEWHHTSMYGNKTPFYGWTEDEFADDYLKHKKEVDTLCKGIDPKTKQPLIDKVEKPQYEHEYEMPQYGEAETAANPIREWRHKQIEKYDQFTGFKGYANATEEEKKERDAYLHSLNEQMEEKIREMLAKDYPDYLAAKNALDAYNNYEEDLRKAIGERIKEYLDIDKYSQRWREQTATTQPTANIETLTNHAESVVQNLHLNNVEIVPDGSSLNGEQATAKGFYNKRTGKIVVVASNHTDIADIEKTVLHEAVAHHGLRQLFGNDFDKFLDTVYAKADIETRRQIAHLSAKHGWNVRTATEEYLASMAGDTNFEQIKPTLWQRIKQLFGEIMSAFGLHHANITDNDLRYILWRSYKNLQSSGKHSILDKAEDIAMQYRLKAGNYADKATDNVLYRSGIDPTATEVLPDARTRYEKETKEPDNIDSVPKTHNFFRRFYKSYVDSMLALKSFTNSVLEATGDKMASHEDTYKAENAMTSKNKTDGEVYNPLFPYMPLYLYM
ncbi:LPD3 domain-containing protein [Prevotella pallens]